MSVKPSRILSAIASLILVLVFATPVQAATGIAVTAPNSISYDPTVGGFSVTGVDVTGSGYVQVGLTLADSFGNPIDLSSPYRIAIGNQCSFDSDWVNSATGGHVVISGDQSVNVIMAGDIADVSAELASVWIYQTDSNFCGQGTNGKFGGALMSAQLQVTAVQSAPGLYWSPTTQHYYQLATQTTDDGMGQPTDDNGNITDNSRYFVRWSTARAEAKQSTITINGSTHVGYLAAITTKAEFDFLNNNVSGGRGKLYPAWVGGSDQASEGNWNWVDGPEAQNFGGDTLTHQVTVYSDPLGNTTSKDNWGYPVLHINGSSESLSGWLLWMRDASGNYVYNSDGYRLAVDFNNVYCTDYNSNVNAMIAGTPNTQATAYGSTIVCDPFNAQGYYLLDGSGNAYFQESVGDSYNTGVFYEVDSNGQWVKDINGDIGALIYPDDFTATTGIAPNYDGARFWGQDSGSGSWPGATPDFCTLRGVRGTCSVSQPDVNGNWQYNDYYVHWSNGDRSYYGNWDGTGDKYGDGAYSPQPDNAYLNGSPEGENALVINWCTRNPSDYSNSDAVEETLYGNSGYHCTPGWNDLAAGDWAGASATYPNPNASYDTPNQIGTTDYVIEYCGYSNEDSCGVSQAASAMIPLIAPSHTCGTSSNNKVEASFEAAHVENATATTPTTTVLNFDDLPLGQLPSQLQTSVGALYGTSYVGSANVYGGAGGVGNYGSPSDAWLVLPTTECYLGFWWSAGNADNHVDIYDSLNNLVGSFSAADLVNDLGACDGTNPYCGHPDNGGDSGELFAFINMRLPSGFAKLHFYGVGFELDNITLSVDAPARSANETTITTTPINLDCSSITAAAAASQLTACPQSVTTTQGTALSFDPLADSTITGYSYPAGVTITAADLHTGVGTPSLDAANNKIDLLSDTVGTYEVNYTIEANGQSSTSRLTVMVQEAPHYNVHFAANGGSGTMQDQSEYQPAALTSNAFTRTGYTFNGWNTQQDGMGTSYADGDTYSFGANTTLYASWLVNNYTLTFDENDGSATTETQNYDYGSTNALTHTTAWTRTGYDLLGWATTAGATSAASSYTVHADATLYAVWRIKNFAITFAKNDGSATTVNHSYNYGATNVLSLANPWTRVGYTFAGWGTSASDTTAATSFTATQAATLYAIWTVNNYTLTYAKNDGGAVTTTSPTTFGATDALNFANPWTRTGYDFLGWATTANATTAASSFTVSGSTTLYAVWRIQSYVFTFDKNDGSSTTVNHSYNFGANNVLSFANPWTRTGYTFLGWNESASAASAATSQNVTQATTMYAIWQLNSYTVTYKKNDGTTASTNVTRTYGSTDALSFANPWTRTGYTFVGWASTAASTSADSSSNISRNTTLFAVWQRNIYTITYAKNDGGSDTLTSSKAYGATNALKFVNTWTRDGYTFLGWSNSASATKASTRYTVTRDATLYAVWVDNAAVTGNTITASVYFLGDSAKIIAKTGDALRALRDKLKGAKNIVISITGWVMETKKKQHDMELSYQRAENIAHVLRDIFHVKATFHYVAKGIWPGATPTSRKADIVVSYTK